MPFGCDETGSRKNGQVGRKSVGRHLKIAGNLARRQTVRLVAHKQSKCVEPRLLREGRKGVECVL